MLGLNHIEIVGRYKNSTVHAYTLTGGLIYSSKNQVFSIEDLDNPIPRLICTIPWDWKAIPSHVRIFDRYLKYSILQVAPVYGEKYLVCNGHHWWCIEANGKVIPIKPFAKTRPMNRGICVATSNNVYVAEYTSNQKRLPIHIFRTCDMYTFEVAWEFPEKEVRHVHAIIEDPEASNRLWVFTGDNDNESNFYVTEDNFVTLEKVCGGEQKYRTTDMIFYNGDLIWGMDSPLVTSFIMKGKRDRLLDAQELFELPGPAYYTCQNQAGGLYMATTVEPGPAVKDDQSHLIGLRPNGKWEDMLQLKTDWFPNFGILYFPRGVLPENYLVFSQRALNPWEGYMTIARDKAWV